MKILHLSTYRHGGAANAAIRLHQGLLNQKQESLFGIKSDTLASPEYAVSARSGLRRWYADQAPRLEYHLARYSHPRIRPVLPGAILPGLCRDLVKSIRPDIVHLHWVDHHFVTTRDLRWLVSNKIPLVWTLHDMAPLSGGFSYREESGLPVAPYGPLQFGDSRKTISAHLLAKRASALENARLIAVAPSRWLAKEARNSPVFSRHAIEHVPYGIDTNLFKPTPKSVARNYWDLPENRHIVLFGADSFDHPRKGLHHLAKALVQWNPTEFGPAPLLVAFGNSASLPSSEFPVPVHCVGRISPPDKLATLYSAADVFVCPSREDNLPNTLIEAMACGTPVVGFKVGGIPDLICDGITGALITCYNESELASGIARILQQGDIMRSTCRDHAQKSLSLDIQARKYTCLYEEVIKI